MVYFCQAALVTLRLKTPLDRHLTKAAVSPIPALRAATLFLKATLIEFTLKCTFYYLHKPSYFINFW